VGILVTSLNLIPLGQLDGGHAAYAVFGRRARDLSKVVLGLLLVFGLLFWFGWIVWFFIILLMGVKHPRVLDEDAPLGRDRTIVAVVLLLIFILSFIPAPVRGYNIADMLRLLWP
jgi:membrane-associated protease RseP (regulator of RpoE activity)